MVLEIEMKEGKGQSTLQHQGIQQSWTPFSIITVREKQKNGSAHHQDEPEIRDKQTVQKNNIERLLQINMVCQIKLLKGFEILG